MARPFINLSDSFKVFKDKVNTISYNVGDPVLLETFGDSDLVQAINELERVFDASAGEIIYPTASTTWDGTPYETETRLLISTAQNGGTDIINISGNNFEVDAANDVVLDAGSNNLLFKHDSVTRFEHILGNTNVLNITGALDQNISGAADISVGGSYRVDATGEITLDAGGAKVKFDLADVNKFLFNLGTNQEIIAQGNLTIDATGDIILDAAAGEVVYQDDSAQYAALTNTGDNNLIIKTNSTTAITFDDNANQLITGNITKNSALDVNVTSGDLTFDVAGDINLDADGADIRMRDGGVNRVVHTLGATNTVTVSGNYTVDASGDINLDADGNDITFRDGTNARITHTLGTTNTVSYNGNLVNDVIGGGLTTLVDNAVQETYGSTYTSNIAGASVVTVGGNSTHDVEGDYTLDVNGGTITVADNGANKFVYNLGTNQEVDVTGNLTWDIAGDQIVDVAGSNITHRVNGTNRFVYTLGATNTVAVTGNLVHDVSGDISLDASTGNVKLLDDGNEYGSLIQASGQLAIRSNGGPALTFGSNTATFSRTLFTDSALDTSANNVAGGINELVSRADSESSDIQTLFFLVDDATGGAASINARVGQLEDLDSSTGFFSTPTINNDTIVNALNELARRTVLVFDENGVLLNN